MADKAGTSATSVAKFLGTFSQGAGTANVVSQTVVSDNAIHVVELTLLKETSAALETDVPSLGAAK
jgi:hypothetical protein